MNLNERMRLEAELQRHYATLENQIKVMGALYDASRHLSINDEMGKRADKLLVLVAREVIATCAAIWLDSSKHVGRDGAAELGAEEARDESLPW